MANFNKVILAGNLTRDPELRYTPKGMAIAKIGLAINRRWKSETGEMKEETTFVDVDAFGKTAETIGQYLKKGRPILIEGRLRYQTWEDKQSGQKKSKLGVVMETFQFHGFRRRPWRRRRFVRSPAGASGRRPPPRPRPTAATPTPRTKATTFHFELMKNIQQPTFNTEHPMPFASGAFGGCWAFDVEC